MDAALLHDGCSLVLTTYEQLRLQRELLLPVRWGVTVLDEGHKIRNPDAEVRAGCGWFGAAKEVAGSLVCHDDSKAAGVVLRPKPCTLRPSPSDAAVAPPLSHAAGDAGRQAAADSAPPHHEWQPHPEPPERAVVPL
jgi:hypothetical protein